MDDNCNGEIDSDCDVGNCASSLVVTGSVPFGSEQVIGPDNCLWQIDHSITGSLPSGTVQYFYNETLLTMPQGNCWFPCTETGTVAIDWEG